MPRQAVFGGLVVDEFGRPAEVAYVGDEPCYIVDDAGFRRHISAEQVDRQVLEKIQERIAGHEDILADQAAKMVGAEDIFSRALILTQLKNMDKQLAMLMETGLPEEARAYLGMMGFRVTINLHGEVVDFYQPGMTDSEEE
jgi:ABC-type iron transport system FetAB ATPase subunit